MSPENAANQSNQQPNIEVHNTSTAETTTFGVEDIVDESIFNPPLQSGERHHLDELTIAELIGLLFRAPLSTFRALQRLAASKSEDQLDLPVMPSNEAHSKDVIKEAGAQPRPDARYITRLGFWLTAFLLVWLGNQTFVSGAVRRDERLLASGAVPILIGLALWFFADLYAHWPDLRRWWGDLSPDARTRWQVRLLPLALGGIGVLLTLKAIFDISPPMLQTGVIITVAGGLVAIVLETAYKLLYRQTPTAASGEAQPWWLNTVHPSRIVLALIGLLLAILTWRANPSNHFTSLGFWSWMASIICWALALAPAQFNILTWLGRLPKKLRSWRIPRNRTVFALLVIMAIAAFFRLYQLDSIPPEMTSDHVEKILDAQRVLDGTHQIFFPNNGGREPFQMYALALFSYLPGVEIGFASLKLLAVIESLITIPVLWWMGREIVGERDQRLGNSVGLWLAGLVAVSYWHVAITRLSLRIILMPLVTALLVIYLVRALRHNRRADWLWAGLILGFSFYTYQASRMLPVVVVIAFILALLKAPDFATRRRYALNFGVTVLISFIVFVPLFSYSVDETVGGPDHFWRRTAGRLFGDDVITETDEEGNIRTRNVTFAERIEAFNENVPVLLGNVRNVLLMFNWKGDVAWINGAPNAPEMDTFTGTLFLFGLLLWVFRMIRYRDAGDWLMPALLLIMLFPSALSIAYPLENPSATRASGALPAAYLMAAFAAAILVQELNRLGRIKLAKISINAGWVLVLVIPFAFFQNYKTYFEDHLQAYLSASLPYSDGGRILRGFAESDGSYGNAFMIAFPYWWDHRALGLEAGLTDWPNGIVKREDIPRFLKQALQAPYPYTLDPNRDLLFFYAKGDDETGELLQEWFPSGRAIEIQTYQAGDNFMIYRVPWLGEDGLQAFFEMTGVNEEPAQ
ncbi:MAG: hypothetical protein D6712_01460 [Chloroflexi bacterium]|nr:MAG: hypothetical protein D6712_01460 [Chloroflexota bacterium]